jgi:hypothetical protein
LIRGFLLSREEAASLLDSWNASCDPPWDRRALEHKLDEAERIAYSKPDGWMLTPRESAFANVDFDGFDK